MVKKGSGISMSIGGSGYSLSRGGGSSGYSLAGSGGGYSLTSASKGYSLTGSGKGYSLTNRLDGMLKGYSSMASGGYANAGMKMKRYSIKQRLYGPVSLFPVPYGKIPDPLDEMLKLYKKKCPHCGSESRGSGSYSLN